MPKPQPTSTFAEEELWHRKAAEIGVECFNSFYFFFKTFWPEMSGEKYVDAPHIKYLCDTLQFWAMRVINGERIMKTIVINVPPGSSKSTIATIALPIWCWLHKPSLSTANISYSASLSSGHAYKARGIVQSRKWKFLFDDIFEVKHDKTLGIVKQNQNEILNNFKGNRFNTSVGGTILGMHYDIGIKDDILSAEQAQSDVERAKANRWDDETTTSRKKNPSCFLDIYISQRLHEEDTCGHVLNKNIDILHICLPAEITATNFVSPESAVNLYSDGILDINRRPKDVLDIIKEQMGQSGYSGQYLQIPFNLEEQDIKPSMFEIIESVPDNIIWDIWVDGAFTEKNENDPSGIDICARHGNDLLWKQSYDLRKKLPDLVAFIVELEETGQFDRQKSRIFIEPKASGYPLAQYLENDTDYNFVLLGVNNKQESKLIQEGHKARHEMIKPKAESGRIKVLKGNWNERAITQICGFPRAAHDEHVDNLGYAINHYYIQENTFIEGYAISRIENNIPGSINIKLSSSVDKFRLLTEHTETDSGDIQLFDFPSKFYRNRYICVLILQSGGTRGGKTCILVLDRHTMTIAALFVSDSIEAAKAGKKALELAFMYEKAYLVAGVKDEVGTSQTEDYDLSHLALGEIKKIRYDRIHFRMTVNDIQRKREKEYGFLINRSTSREVYYNLKEMTETNKVNTIPVEIFEEIKLLERKKDNGEVGGREGYTTNCALAYAIALKVNSEMKDKVVQKKAKKADAGIPLF